jgi:hypothetical protein
VKLSPPSVEAFYHPPLGNKNLSLILQKQVLMTGDCHHLKKKKKKLLSMH